MCKKFAGLTLAIAGVSLAAAAQTSAVPPARYGDALTLGNGRIYAYQQTRPDGTPVAIGIEFPLSTLTNLPKEENDGLNCWDNNGDNQIALDDTECSGGHARTLFFDSNLTPFKYITINWEPYGHVPADVYDMPHFDFHFYMMSYVEKNRIAVGPCFGTMNCAQVDRGVVPLPQKYVHYDFFNTKLVFSRMGNHYADGTSPEFHGQRFTRTFILGSFDGHVTFYEPMVALEYLQTKPNQCEVIKQPTAFEKAGYYPTQYCVRYLPTRNTYTISLESFVYRDAG